MLYEYEKGVSPLVATVLLIAFAVSLGSVIMNWAASPITDTSEGQFSACSAVSFKVINRGAEKAICLDRDRERIVIDLENGNSAIDGIRLSYIGKTSNFIDYNEKIQPGVLWRVELDYDVVQYGEPRNVKLTPIVNRNVYCSSQGIHFSFIEDC